MYKREYICVTVIILFLGLCSLQHENVVLAQCACQNVHLKARISDTVVEPGDTVAFTIIAENRNVCLYDLSNGRLEVDPGKLGHIIHPKLSTTQVGGRQTQDISYFELKIPDVAEGKYTVSMLYTEGNCARRAAATLEVRIGLRGTISVVSSPQSLWIDESGSVRVIIDNPTKKDITYTVSVSAPSTIKMTQPSYVLSVKKESSKELTMYFTALKEGTHTVSFILSAGATALDVTSVIIKVEEPATGVLEIISIPFRTTQKETVNLELRVTNTSKKNIVYTVSASPSGGLSLPQTVWNISVAAGDSKSLIASATAVGSDKQGIDFELSYEGRSLSKTSWNTTVEEIMAEENTVHETTVEENTPEFLVLAGVAVAALAVASSLMKLRKVSKK